MDSLHTSLPSSIPLIVKASCDERIKRIRFAPIDLTTLQYCDFQKKVAGALQFDDVDFCITWEDDDGEHCDIASTEDLQEALLYFCPSQVEPSIQALNMRINVRVDTNVNLSDYGSSIWGGSEDEEGTVASGSSSRSSRVGRRYLSQSSSKSISNHSNGLSSTRSFVTPPLAGRPSSSSPSQCSSSVDRKGLSATCSSSKASCPSSSFPRWLSGRFAGVGSTKSRLSNYSDALSGLSSLNLEPARRMGDSDSSEAESEASAQTRGPQTRKSKKRGPSNGVPEAAGIHDGVQCRSCQIKPIIGIRFHCASCPDGADFVSHSEPAGLDPSAYSLYHQCADCERTGYSTRAGVGHEAMHVMLRLAKPLDSPQAVDALSYSLAEAQRRLGKESDSGSSRNGTDVQDLVQANNNHVVAKSHGAIKCSFCAYPIVQESRYLCANCPLVSGSSLDGYNLCSHCEMHSLQCHDPSHFFVKINYVARSMNRQGRVPLGERWEVLEATHGGSLLPMLYAQVEETDPLQSPLIHSASNQSIRLGDGLALPERQARNDHSTLSSPNLRNGLSRTASGLARQREQEMEMTMLRESQSRHIVPLDRLVHPCILCDNCFSVVQGIWYRCCHCTASFDLCQTCESKIAHDPSHSFAVFKQPVDLDLFKSCVDHQDAGEGPIGASRHMLSFPLL